MKQNILVVDWDYFFPIPHPDTEESWYFYDWGHAETGKLYSHHLWPLRASDFFRAGKELPGVNDEWKTFWNRFTFNDDTAGLYFADSNSAAIKPEVRGEGAAQLWLYDAHHDSGYGRKLSAIRNEGRVTCEDWMVGYRIFDPKAKLHVRYPGWKPWAMDFEPEPSIKIDRQVDDGSPNPVKFDTVFVCRSASWVPSWEDGKFTEFIESCPISEVTEIGDCEPRDFDEAEARAAAEQMKKVIEAHNG